MEGEAMHAESTYDWDYIQLFSQIIVYDFERSEKLFLTIASSEAFVAVEASQKNFDW